MTAPVLPPGEIQLTIRMRADGAVQVEGPLENALLCYGLLGFAHQIVVDYQQKAKQFVQPVSLSALRSVPK